jgi:hypothetical protein
MLVAKVVEEEERIEFLRLAESECALELNASAFESGRGCKDLLYGTKRHRTSE